MTPCETQQIHITFFQHPASHVGGGSCRSSRSHSSVRPSAWRNCTRCCQRCSSPCSRPCSLSCAWPRAGRRCPNTCSHKGGTWHGEQAARAQLHGWCVGGAREPSSSARGRGAFALAGLLPTLLQAQLVIVLQRPQRVDPRALHHQREELGLAAAAELPEEREVHLQAVGIENVHAEVLANARAESANGIGASQQRAKIAAG